VIAAALALAFAAAAPAPPPGPVKFRLSARAVRDAFELMDATLNADPDVSYDGPVGVRYSSAKCVMTAEPGVAECKLRMTFPSGTSQKVRNTVRRAGADDGLLI
jgi:hypothetical protein